MDYRHPDRRTVSYTHLDVYKRQLLASAGLDKLVKLWSVADGKLLATLRAHTDRILALAITPDRCV